MQAQCFNQNKCLGNEDAKKDSIWEGSIQLWKCGGRQVTIMGAIIIDHQHLEQHNIATTTALWWLGTSHSKLSSLGARACEAHQELSPTWWSTT
jgi:hypothetical protein